jgi:hypothetical protein
MHSMTGALDGGLFEARLARCVEYLFLTLFDFCDFDNTVFSPLPNVAYQTFRSHLIT